MKVFFSASTNTKQTASSYNGIARLHPENTMKSAPIFPEIASFLGSDVKAKAISKASYSVLVGRKEQSFSFDAKMFLRNQESMPAEVAEDL